MYTKLSFRHCAPPVGQFMYQKKLFSLHPIAAGLIFALINAILIFGAHTQNSKAILIWMILGGIEAAVYAIYVILIIVGLVTLNPAPGQYGELLAVLIVALFVYAILVVGIIWTIVIAKRAREEIDNPNTNVDKA